MVPAKKLTMLMFFINLVMAASVYADVPRLMNYQGFITDISGEPINGSTQLTFTIYHSLIGGIGDWTETHPSVKVTEGHLAVTLGCINAIDDVVFNTAGKIFHPEVHGYGEEFGINYKPKLEENE